MREKSCDSTIEKCGHIFLSWSWATGIIITAICATGIAAWNGSARLTTIKLAQEAQEKEINELQIQLKAMPGKLDTVIYLLKKRDENTH